MKESERIKKELGAYPNEDSDFGFFKLKEKHNRALRIEKFIEKDLKWLESLFEVEFNPNNNGYKFTSKKHGVLVYYPQKDKLHRFNPQKWFNNGLKWLNKEFKNGAT